MPKYVAGRVLIAVNDVLSSNLNGLTLNLTGAQVGLLRTIARYLNVTTTFYASLGVNGYDLPNETEWNEIDEIVSEMELKLMGNDNVLWGYADRLVINMSDSDVSAGDFLALSDPVPSGVVYRIEAMTIRNLDGDRGISAIAVGNADEFAVLVENPTPIALLVDTFLGMITLKEGDKVRMFMADCEEGDRVDALVWGYKTNVNGA